MRTSQLLQVLISILKQNLRIEFIIKLLLLSQVCCQDNLMQGQSCDKNIIQQLVLQNIQYKCSLTEIIVENQEEIKLDLELRDLQIFSQLLISNIKNVYINNLILENLITKQHKDNFSLIKFLQIENLSIQFLSISNSFQNKMALIKAEDIKNMQVNQFTLSNLSLERSLSLVSENLAINQMILLNTIVCEFYLCGEQNLTINDIYVRFDDQQLLEDYQCFQEYSTFNEINIQNIFFDINKIGFPTEVIKFANIYKEQSTSEGKININQIYYKSEQQQQSIYTIILQLGKQNNENVHINIQKIIYKQKESNVPLQIYAQEIKSIFISEIILDGFGQELQYSTCTYFMKIAHIRYFYVGSIVFSSNNNINGIILSGEDIQNLEIFRIEIKTQVLFSQNVIDLNTCTSFMILNLIAQDDIFRGYLINAYSTSSLKFVDFNLQNIQFNQKSIFNLVGVKSAFFQYFQIDKIQPKIFQTAVFNIELQQLNYDTLQTIYRNVQADLQSNQNLQLLVLNGLNYQVLITESQIMNGSSTNFGGCINLIQSSQILSQLIIYNSKFKNCKSKYSGGAIAGIRQLEIKNSSFEQCSSQIGGALYMTTNINLDNSYFLQNKGYLSANNYNKNIIDLKIGEVFEIVDITKDYQLIQTDKFLYPGLTYMIKISIETEDLKQNALSNQYYFGNIFDLLIDPSNNFISVTPPQLLNVNFPFLLWYAFDIEFDGQQTIDFEKININFVLNYNLKTNQYKIYNGCKKQGMEQFFLDGQRTQQFICKYCDFMRAGYDGVCQNCQTDYFSSCYGNYSMLKSGYWRSNYTVESSDILYCSNNPLSCQGGSGIGNNLCYEGHVGVQCLDCDINGNYWQDKYSQLQSFPETQFKFANICQRSPEKPTQIKINKIQYQSYFSQMSSLIIMLKLDKGGLMQILFEKFNSISIQEVIVEGFFGLMKNSNYISFLSATNIDYFYINSIAIQQSNQIDGIILMGQEIQTLLIQKLEIQPSAFFSQNVIDLKNYNSQVMNGSSINFGGCINLISTTVFTQSQLIISNSKFKNCKSKYSGGAISGIKQLEIKNSSFEQCSSQIGGAFYMAQHNETPFDKSFFIQNKGYLVANNYNQQTVNFQIDEIYEVIDVNDNNQLIKIDKILYPGLTYLIKISIKAEGEWQNTFNNTNNFGNIYDLLIHPSNNFLSLTPPQLLKINFPFLLWYAFDIPFNEKQIINFEPININFVLQSTIQTQEYQIYNGCKEQGMEQVFLDNKKNQQYICKYCDQMKASYEGVCENCQTDYFSLCYGNYSMLKQSYWRSKYTVDPSDIYFCSNNPQSCQGVVLEMNYVMKVIQEHSVQIVIQMETIGKKNILWQAFSNALNVALFHLIQ
ncbi:hypothetical protein TTHERM_01100490 (macronuclear) [Tetrahymena thermophila SB210]|uniref:Transmembrane protein n=1 Tax=Tetrahymena thermophila (strain SB210) TaxID=312017 RepID=Q22BG3_TETTS|nr:hypothetical protein TTHERM_01100490 [Tetrahymena thermophila SB210]EAR82641.2 hypothetical protein TTHERM_01100490 [Tetrahymena thermophila SB210]|eukprot:XP_001030304.2 hypothetical protein TTHERM_01100490 [Tetrahymena thermophila SB210]